MTKDLSVYLGNVKLKHIPKKLWKSWRIIFQNEKIKNENVIKLIIMRWFIGLNGLGLIEREWIQTHDGHLLNQML